MVRGLDDTSLAVAVEMIHTEKTFILKSASRWKQQFPEQWQQERGSHGV